MRRPHGAGRTRRTPRREHLVALAAAGFEMTTPADLVEVVVRQAPGTWLPLSVLRGEQRLEILARFPQSFATHP